MLCARARCRARSRRQLPRTIAVRPRRRWQKIYRNRFGCETLVFAIAFNVSRQRAHADRADRAREQLFLSCLSEIAKVL